MRFALSTTFCPKALNGRKLAAIDVRWRTCSRPKARWSVADPMMRAARPLPELRPLDRDPAGEDLRRQCARLAVKEATVLFTARPDHLSELREADPDTGGRIGRIAQVWPVHCSTPWRMRRRRRVAGTS